MKRAKIRAWAPAMIRRDGKYYFYFCAEQKIGVAVSDKPTGKFLDALDKALITPSKEYPGQAIDPFAFIDDGGQACLYLRHAIPNGNGCTRETCIARMEFEADGRI